MKKLYHVTIESEYYCLAEDNFEAEDLADEFMLHNTVYDFSIMSHAVEDGDEAFIPNEWMDSIPFGSEKLITLAEWFNARRQEEKDKKKQEQLDGLQMKLPLKEK